MRFKRMFTRLRVRRREKRRCVTERLEPRSVRLLEPLPEAAKARLSVRAPVQVAVLERPCLRKRLFESNRRRGWCLRLPAQSMLPRSRPARRVVTPPPVRQDWNHPLNPYREIATEPAGAGTAHKRIAGRRIRCQAPVSPKFSLDSW